MSSFQIVEHIIPGQHIREHPHSVNGRQETALQLAIKQYIPLDQPNPVPDNAVTVLGLHGNGFPQELYEPLWGHLYAHLKKQSVPLRGIWMADVSNQGASGVLNEDIQGDTTHWYDHSRDLLHMVNHFRDDMPRPIIGVAHSMGCAQLVHLSAIHPRLLSTLILYEPIILDVGASRSQSEQRNPAALVAHRRDLWESREKAEIGLRKSLRKWDPRVVDRYLEFGLRPVPTRLYNQHQDPQLPTSAVTLTTTKHQEMWTFAIPNLEPESAGLDRLLLADWDVQNERPYGFARPECAAAMRDLPFLRPSVLWVFGGESYFSFAASQDSKMHATGTGAGGNGGVAKGMVEKAVIEGASHTLVFEEIDRSAEVAADWVGRWFQSWLSDEKILADYQSKRSDRDMLRVSEESLKTIRMTTWNKRPNGKL
ncbi:toxin biosynthesis protein [Penicillium hispanicum]|uniref:toxin biosynthesis protein n=1 Tax=Penicillium hispanicum TaxID=1080232 RepID=UPI002540B4CD|nr:toxin biosynthesis protein [Penicillium hispanicum]KAJ5594735.1 toxin biosynthesis protein [Penicillium hispanicum]